MDRESALFYVVLFLFACTGIVTILGIIQKVSIEKRYLNGLFSALVLELIAAVLYLFSNTQFFGPQPEDSDLIVTREELPIEYKETAKSDLLAVLRTHDSNNAKLKRVEAELISLKEIISNQTPPYSEVIQALESKAQEISALQLKYAKAKEYEQKYIKLEKQFLVRMATLNTKLSEWGTSINLRWRPEEKRVIAKMLQEAFKQIGFMDQSEIPNDDPEKTHQLLIAYQTEKNFRETGFLTSEVLAFIIRDYLA